PPRPGLQRPAPCCRPATAPPPPPWRECHWPTAAPLRLALLRRLFAHGRSAGPIHPCAIGERRSAAIRPVSLHKPYHLAASPPAIPRSRSLDTARDRSWPVHTPNRG